MSDYDYDEFLKDSSDDCPKYADGLLPKKTKDWRGEREYLRLKWGEQGRRIEVPVADRTFKEVIRLARAAIQPWWTQEYRDSTERAINQVEKYFEKNILKTD